MAIQTSEATFEQAVSVYHSANDESGASANPPSESSSDFIDGIWHLENINGRLGYVSAGKDDIWSYSDKFPVWNKS